MYLFLLWKVANSLRVSLIRSRSRRSERLPALVREAVAGPSAT